MTNFEDVSHLNSWLCRGVGAFVYDNDVTEHTAGASRAALRDGTVQVSMLGKPYHPACLYSQLPFGRQLCYGHKRRPALVRSAYSVLASTGMEYAHARSI